MGPAALPSTSSSTANGQSHTFAQAPVPMQAGPPSAEGEEARLVDSICTPGGLRAQPDRGDLKTFVESLGNLDGDQLVELLTAKMVGAQCADIVLKLRVLLDYLQRAGATTEATFCWLYSLRHASAGS